MHSVTSIGSRDIFTFIAMCTLMSLSFQGLPFPFYLHPHAYFLPRAIACNSKKNIMTMSTRDANKNVPFIPHNSLKQDGYSKDGEATATCYCGAVQLAFVSRSSSPPNPETQFQESTISLKFPSNPSKYLMNAAANSRSRPD
jgi:hypothetical protein